MAPIGSGQSLGYNPAMLHFPQPLYDQMIAALQRVYPLEGCGFVAGRRWQVERIYPVPNRLASARRFAMEPRAQLAALYDLMGRQLTLLAIYHSHPDGPPQPSTTDLAGTTYPEALQVIVSLAGSTGPRVRAFKPQDNGWQEIALVVQP